MTIGFSFYANGANQLYSPGSVTPEGADSPAHCVAKYAQIAEMAWSVGGEVNMTIQDGITNFTGCVDACTADATCQYITYDYNSANSPCQIKTTTQGVAS